MAGIDSRLYKNSFLLAQTGHGASPIIASVMLPQDTLATLDENATLIFWDISTGKQLRELSLLPDKPTRLFAIGSTLYAFGDRLVQKITDWREEAYREDVVINTLTYFKMADEEFLREKHLQQKVYGQLSAGGAYYAYFQTLSKFGGYNLFDINTFAANKRKNKTQLPRIVELRNEGIELKEVDLLEHAMNEKTGRIAMIYETAATDKSAGAEVGQRKLAFMEWYKGIHYDPKKEEDPSSFWFKQKKKFRHYFTYWDRPKIRLLLDLERDTPFWLNPRADYIFWIADKKLIRVNLEENARIDIPLSIEGPGTVSSILGSDDSLLCAVSFPERMEVFDLEQKRRRVTFQTAKPHRLLAFSRKPSKEVGYHLATTDLSGQIYLWNFEKEKGWLERKFYAKMPKIIDIAQLPGQPLSLVFNDQTSYGLKVDKSNGLSFKKQYVHNEPWSKTVNGKDGMMAIVSKPPSSKVALIKEEEALPIPYEGEKVRALVFSPDSKYLALLPDAGHPSIYLYATDNGQLLMKWNRPGIHSLAFHTQGYHLFAGYWIDDLYWLACYHWVEGQVPDSQPHWTQPMANLKQMGTGFFLRSVLRGGGWNTKKKAWRLFYGPPFSITVSETGKYLTLHNTQRCELFQINDLERGIFQRLLSNDIQPNPKKQKLNWLNAQLGQINTRPVFFQGDEMFLLKRETSYGSRLDIWEWEELLAAFKSQAENKNDQGYTAPSKSINIRKVEFDHLTAIRGTPFVLAYQQGEEGVNIFNWQSGSFIGTLYLANEHKFILVDPQYNYLTTSDGYDLIAFKLDEKVIPIDQLDLLFNRPHSILKSMGFFEETLIQNYEKAYDKRRARIGALPDFVNENEEGQIDPINQLLARSALSQVHIIEKEGLPVSTDDPELTLVACAVVPEDKDKLRRLVVYVNNVPACGKRIWLGKRNTEIENIKHASASDLGFEKEPREAKGSKGLALQPPYDEEMIAKIRLTLSKGLNKIEVSLLDMLGVEWLRDGFYVNYIPNPNIEQPKPRLFLAGIGVSRHQDKSLNLQFPAQNILKFVSLFLGSSIEKEYEIYQVLTFVTGEEEDNARLEELADIHESYTHANSVEKNEVLGIKERVLSHTREDDRVIIFFSGHGETDENDDLFLDTFALDKRNLKDTGISYEEMEGLLDDIPARHKLLLLDTCFSGEIDKEGEIEAFELMKDAFFDARRGTGATVIASSGGSELAKEHEAWQGSVFTFCLLKALQEKQQLTVSELQDILAREVLREAREKIDSTQNPDFRVRNIANDWRVW